MVKLKGQLLSLGASGSLGKAVTFSNWKGRAYAKKFASPTNNQQMTQLGLRAGMTFLSQQWANISAADKATWVNTAAASQISPFDAYVGDNLSALVDDKSPSKAFPSAPVAFNPGTFQPAADVFDNYIIYKAGVVPTPVAWSMYIYRSDTTGFTPGPSNMVHAVIPLIAASYLEVRDVPPTHGTWYYRQRTGDATGSTKLHTAELVVVF